MATFLADGFRDVDAAADTGKIIGCLSFLNDLPDFRAYKERAIDSLHLRADSRVADIACGLGFDLLRLHRRAPAGCVVGFDSSRALVEAARRTVAGLAGVEVIEADAHAIAAADGAFDDTRIDRSLQHIASADRVIAEMARLTRPGGFVSASEPDWRTFSMTLDGSPVGARLAAAWISGFRNPCIGGALVDLLADRGLDISDHMVDAVLLRRFEDADIVFDIHENAARCVQRGIVAAADAAALLAEMQARSDAGRFYAMLCIHTVTGRKR
jgi:ubiquinone/menaquinone biosynthesis C-methylase UbiE